MNREQNQAIREQLFGALKEELERGGDAFTLVATVFQTLKDEGCAIVKQGYSVFHSEEDQEYVAIHTDHELLSWLDKSPLGALAGLIGVIRKDAMAKWFATHASIDESVGSEVSD